MIKRNAWEVLKEREVALPLIGKLYVNPACANEVLQNGRKNRKPITTRPDADGILMAKRIAHSVNLLDKYSAQQLEQLDKRDFDFFDLERKYRIVKQVLLMTTNFTSEEIDKLEWRDVRREEDNKE